jgi:hypothetical protein
MNTIRGQLYGYDQNLLFTVGGLLIEVIWNDV